jgi:hypothetical protein
MMKSVFAAIKLIVLLFILFHGQVFANQANQFLSCVGDRGDSGGTGYALMYNQLPGQIKTQLTHFGDVLANLGTDRRLTLLSIRDRKNNIMLADTNNKSKVNPGLLIFDNVTQAKEFCDGLAKICANTFNTKEKPYIHPREVQFLYIYQNSQKLFLSGKAQVYKCFPIREDKEILSAYE